MPGFERPAGNIKQAAPKLEVQTPTLSNAGSFAGEIARVPFIWPIVLYARAVLTQPLRALALHSAGAYDRASRARQIGGSHTAAIAVALPGRRLRWNVVEHRSSSLLDSGHC